jgi:hypothetical protein
MLLDPSLFNSIWLTLGGVVVLATLTVVVMASMAIADVLEDARRNGYRRTMNRAMRRTTTKADKVHHEALSLAASQACSQPPPNFTD